MKKIFLSLSLLIVLSLSSNAQMHSRFTNVTQPGGHDGTIDMRVKGGVEPYVYIWNDGSTDEDRSNLKSGVYTVSVSDQAGCTVTTSFNITEPGLRNSGKHVLEFTSDIQVFPNPTDGLLNLQYSGTQASDISIKVTDLSGKSIYEKKISSTDQSIYEKIDLSGQAKGVYLVEVISEFETFNSRIVLQ